MLGVFDSGVGGLTVLDDIRRRFPLLDTYYLGDSLRAPYGNKTHEELVRCTWEGVRWLFDRGCHLVIVACNSASASALREIQHTKLATYPGKYVLGVIRPTIEALAAQGHRNIAVLSTQATADSGAYVKEFKKVDPSIHVISHACPAWASMIEEGRAETPEMRADVTREIRSLETNHSDYDAVLLACTHYPHIKTTVEETLSHHVPVYDQGPLIAASLADYLIRHPERDALLEKNGRSSYFVTGDAERASLIASKRFGFDVKFEHTNLSER